MRIRASLKALKKRVRDRALFCELSRELDERLRYVLVWERRRGQRCMAAVGERAELLRAYAACITRCVDQSRGVELSDKVGGTKLGGATYVC